MIRNRYISGGYLIHRPIPTPEKNLIDSSFRRILDLLISVELKGLTMVLYYANAPFMLHNHQGLGSF